MPFIETIAKTDAAGTVKEMYDTAEASMGYLPNYVQIFSHRPEAFLAWQKIVGTINGNMSLRRYELVTIAAARKLRGSYCMLAHSDTALKNSLVSAEQLMAITQDYHDADLSDEDVAVMEFAEKVIANSCGITQADVDHLRSFGMSDAEILDVTMAAAVRCFFSKTLDALNATPDAKYMQFDEPLRNALAVGRPYGDQS